MYITRGLLCGALAACAIMVGCQTAVPPVDPVPSDPDVAAESLRVAWESALPDRLYGSYRGERGQQLRSRAMVRRQVGNLAFRHPDHVPTRTLAGIMAYEAGDPIEATRHLDHVLRQAPRSPDVAVLRARIALEQGSTAYATGLLQDQIRLSPSHAGLREAQASAYFMTDDFSAASAALSAAEGLGSPSERIAYNRGLIHEQEGRTAAAIEMYKKAVELAPGWSMPSERLAGLEGAPSVGSAPSATIPAKTMGMGNGFPPPAEKRDSSRIVFPSDR